MSVCGTGTAGLPSRPFSTVQPQLPCGRVATPTRTRLSVSAAGISAPGSLPAWTARVSPRNLACRIRHWSNDPSVVQDCLPGVHRPGPRGRGLGPTNPSRITRATEPSGLRWWGFAPHFSVTHSGIRTRPSSTAGLRCGFSGRSTLPYHDGMSHHPARRHDTWPRWILGAAALDQ